MTEGILSTEEILAHRRLNHDFDKRWVEWALEMLATGHDSPSLAILAGESGPFNQFEMAALVDRTLHELEINQLDSDEQAIVALTSARVRRYLQAEMSASELLKGLSDLSSAMGYPAIIHDFYRLRFALDDLQTDQFSPHWPEATPKSIEQIIKDRCQSWLVDQNDRASPL